MTTLSPGTWANQASRHCECWGPGALGHPHDDGHGELVAEHVAHLGDLVDDAVHGAGDEIHEHDLHDGTQAAGGGARRERGQAGLADRGVDDAPGAELLEQVAARAEGSAGQPHVLADEKDALVPLHFLLHGFLDGEDISNVFHVGLL
jgi:hypothetical protein